MIASTILIIAQNQEGYIRVYENLAANKEHQKAQAKLDKVMEVMEELNISYQIIVTHWATLESCVLDHAILPPPISVSSSKSYTKDWAIIQVHISKVNTSNFDGNVIDLGTCILLTGSLA